MNNWLLMLSYRYRATGHVFPHIPQKHTLVVTTNELQHHLYKVNLQQSNVGVQTLINLTLKAIVYFVALFVANPISKIQVGGEKFRKQQLPIAADKRHSRI
ncbi:MAG: hypothetical protein ABW185_24605 [Sedimenticola sp.]